MKRKGGKYTYVPKDEIAEVRTFNDVSFENDDLLDGAYVRGRKRKFKHGGMTHKRPMSLEEQAAESVGYDTWYMMDAVDQKGLVDELVSTGMIAPMYGWGGKMADGGKITIEGDIDAGEDVFVYVDGKEVVSWSADEIAEDDFAEETVREVIRLSKQDPKELLRRIHIMNSGMYADGGGVPEKIKLYYHKTDGGAEYLCSEKVKGTKDEGSLKSKICARIDGAKTHGGELYLDKDRLKIILFYHKTDGGAEYLCSSKVRGTKDEGSFDSNYIVRIDGAKKYGGELMIKNKMADGGYLYLDKEEKQSAVSEAVKIAEFAYMNDISASGNSLEDFSNKIFELSGISYAKAYLRLAYDSMKNLGFADGGEISYVVKYSMKDTPEIVKEKVFADKDAAELFHETISDDEDLVVMDLQEIKPAPAAAPKKSLFASAKPAPATTAAAKKKRERVQVDGIEDEIARYDQLKATINNAKAEQEVIGGRLKEIGREKFLELYEQRGVRPANFDLADGDQNILLEVTDKYLKVEPEKAELLRQFDGLLEEKTTYEFDSELLEKEVSEGMTIGDVISMLIQDSKLIPENDKANLIKAKMSMRVPKGTIDRLMDYDNPREVFSLISPILALK